MKSEKRYNPSDKSRRSTVASSESSMGTVAIGTIAAFILQTSSIPTGWLLCDGNPVNGQTYPEAYNTYGITSTPNLNGQVLLGAGPNYTLGTSGGESTVKLSLEQIPSHQHFGWGYNGSMNWGTGNSNGKSYTGADGHDGDNYLFGSTFTGGNVSNQVNTSNNSVTGATQGDNNAHNNMQPYYVVNYIIYVGPPQYPDA